MYDDYSRSRGRSREANDINQMLDTIEFLRIQNSDLNEDLFHAGNEINELRYKN